MLHRHAYKFFDQSMHTSNGEEEYNDRNLKQVGTNKHFLFGKHVTDHMLITFSNFKEGRLLTSQII